MKKPVPLEAKQAEMRERQRCKTCGLRLDRTGWVGASAVNKLQNLKLRSC